MNSVCGIRSTGRIVTDLADRLMAEGHECRIAYGREKVPQKYQEITYRIGTQYDVYMAGLKTRILDNEGFNSRRATKKFLKWASAYNPDILWLHNLHGYYVNIDLLFDWIKSRPDMEVRWTLHDCWTFTGHCSDFGFVGCNKWETGCTHCCQKNIYPASFGLDRCVSNYNKKMKIFTGVKNMKLITPSQWLAGLVKRSFLKEYEVTVINNTIDTTVFCPTASNFREKYNLTEKKILLGVATAWGPRKGLNDFQKLAEMLDESWAVVLVGLKEKQIRKMPKNILCIARTNSRVELAQIYTAADVFVNLTCEDNYPTVNLEAQACGTPCVTYRTGGSAESVPAENVVEQHDLQAVIEIINRLTANEPKE